MHQRTPQDAITHRIEYLLYLAELAAERGGYIVMDEMITIDLETENMDVEKAKHMQDNIGTVFRYRS